MSWVSTNKLKSLGNTLRTKFTTNELVLANADKSKGAHLNVGGQDGLITLSPMVEDGVTPAALWVTDSEANNATELTGGTLSYVNNVGADDEDYTSLSLVGGVVNVSGKSGAQRRITNAADPINDNDVVNKKYCENPNKIFYNYSASKALSALSEVSGSLTSNYIVYNPDNTIIIHENGLYWVKATYKCGVDKSYLSVYENILIWINLLKIENGVASALTDRTVSLGALPQSTTQRIFPIANFSRLVYFEKDTEIGVGLGAQGASDAKNKLLVSSQISPLFEIQAIKISDNIEVDTNTNSLIANIGWISIEDYFNQYS